MSAILVGIHIINALMEGYLYRFGMVPRETTSLPFIFTSPFIHGDWAHLLNNLVGLSVFSTLCLFRGVQFYLKRLDFTGYR